MASQLLAHALGLRDASTSPAVATTLFNAATTRLLLGFIPLTTKTVSKVKFFVSATSGTPGANFSCDLVSFAAGAHAGTTGPNATLETKTGTPVSGAWLELTGFTTSVTGGVQYGFVIRNTHATPAANNFSVRHVANLDPSLQGTTIGWFRRTSTDSGSTYGSQANQLAGFRIEFSDGTFLGVPISNAAATAVGDGVYSARESGVLFTTPANTKLVVKGIGCRISITGTPTGNPRFILYRGTTLVDTTLSVPQWQSTTAINGYFASPITLDTSTQYRMVLGETTQSDASGNRFGVSVEYTVENDANSKAMLPFGGMTKTYWDGSTWTDTDTSALAMWLSLDTDTEFAATSSGTTIAGTPLLRGMVS
jgi:hypothetical protein